MNTKLTTGLEMELWVVDERGRLCDGRHLADAHERATPEFVGPLLEVRTEPHADEDRLRRDLSGTLTAVLDAARDDDKRLVPLGTPLSTVTAPAYGDRGRLFEAIYGDGVVSAKNCAGTHVHFQKGDSEAAVADQLTLLTALDPALALVSSSPYYCGRRGANSSRGRAYRTACGPAFRRFCDLWDYPESLPEWEDRIADAFEAFRLLAAVRGVDPARVEASFSPEDTVLNPVRLRYSQPTVEWRAPDSTLPSQVLRLAADVRTLVGSLETRSLEFGSPGVDADAVRVPRFRTLRTLSDRAIAEGLAAEPVRRYLQRLGFNLGSYQPITQQLYGPAELSAGRACDLRLEYARRLEADVQSLTGHGPVTPAAKRLRSL